MNDAYEPVPRVEASVGDPDFDRIMTIVQAMLTAAALDQLRDGHDPALHTALTMAAAGVLSGYLGGASIIAGLAHDKDKRRMGEMMLTNFRTGIGLGKSSALQSLSETEATRQ